MSDKVEAESDFISKALERKELVFEQRLPLDKDFSGSRLVAVAKRLKSEYDFAPGMTPKVRIELDGGGEVKITITRLETDAEIRDRLNALKRRLNAWMHKHLSQAEVAQLEVVAGKREKREYCLEEGNRG